MYFYQALHVLGLNRAEKRGIPLDKNYKMNINILESQIKEDKY
jgi:hypothetical protein